MHCEGKLNLKSHNTSYCLIEVVTKAGLTVVELFPHQVCFQNQGTSWYLQNDPSAQLFT